MAGWGGCAVGGELAIGAGAKGAFGAALRFGGPVGWGLWAVYEGLGLGGETARGNDDCALYGCRLNAESLPEKGDHVVEPADSNVPKRPTGVPENWQPAPGKKEGHVKWGNPENPNHDYVRVKPDGTITQVRDGKAYDVDGNQVDLRDPAAHGIGPDDFVFRPGGK